MKITKEEFLYCKKNNVLRSIFLKKKLQNKDLLKEISFDKTLPCSVYSFQKDFIRPSSLLEKENYSILFIDLHSKKENFRIASLLHELMNNLSFVFLEEFMNKAHSYKYWNTLHLSTLFIPKWNVLKSWQKNQIKQFIYSNKNPLSSKLIIGI